ncbi:FBD-associated F-box protein At1g61320, partial [Linum grandiflorum]
MANNVVLNGSVTSPFPSEELGLMHHPPKRTRGDASSSIYMHRGNNDAQCKDFLSLPNDILKEILGFLDVRQLVRFSTVAKQFRYCTKYGKRLDFDLSFLRTLIDIEQYEPIVNRIMDHHNGPKIRSLKLCFNPTNDVDNQAMVANWINKAAQKKVEELELNFDRGLDPFRVTFDLLFQIKTLEVLRLVFVDLGSPINDFQITGLQFLKVYSMKNININVVILDALLKSCTKLETLEIIHCYTPDCFRISAENLNMFRKFRLANCIGLKEITINAPSLTTLHYSGQLIAFNFENCENFADFLFDLKSTRWAIIYVNHFMLNKLMFNFLSIEVLTTTSILLEDMQHVLLANGGSGGNHARVQEQLSLVQWPSSQMILANPMLVRSNPHLEQLKLTGFRFNSNEMELLCYFLLSGHNLKTVAIFSASPRHW